MGSHPTVASKGRFYRRRPELSELAMLKNNVAFVEQVASANVHGDMDQPMEAAFGYVHVWMGCSRLPMFTSMAYPTVKGNFE